jgi:hypothetical protein
MNRAVGARGHCHGNMGALPHAGMNRTLGPQLNLKNFVVEAALPHIVCPATFNCEAAGNLDTILIDLFAMPIRVAFLAVFAALSATAQTNQDASFGQRVQQIRLDCIQKRRVICGKILKVLPDGVVVDSGYTNLVRPPLDSSWLLHGTVQAQRAINLVENNQQDSMCIGLVFLTDLPKKPVAAVYDYVNLAGFPAGQYTYTSVGNVQRTIRKFSTKLVKAVQWKVDEDERHGAQPK